MLPKSHRITPRSRLSYLLKKGNRCRSARFTVCYAPNRFHHNRFAVICTKKLAGTAVARNKLRRRIYEAIRKSARPHGSKMCYDMAVIALQPLKKCSYKELEFSLLLCLKKIS